VREITAELLQSTLITVCWAIGGAIALTGIDDLAVDLTAHARSLLRRITVYSRFQRAACSHLPPRRERPIAILVPAWQEAPVLGHMLRHLRATLTYHRYRVFVGHYPNDPETADAACSADPSGRWLELIGLQSPGPTNKADCLNAIWSGIHDYEERSGEHFELFVLHDAEDIVHADELKIFNYLADRADMIQLPVVPLARHLHDFVAGTYLDEFAESHQKDLVLRERIAGGVPSAGVGCAFSREALQAASESQGGRPFPPTSLTEDYALALVLLRQGRRTIFVRLADHPDGYRFSARPIIGTREYFPERLAEAVRQKARWLIGITLQSWQEQGWPGTPGAKYMLLRDRKALIVAPLAIAAYILATTILVYEGARASGVLEASPLFAHNHVLLGLLTFNGLLLLWRATHRLFYVWRLYGPAQGLLSLPRLPVANVINCCATLRALRLYLLHRLMGQPLTWDKTRHAFPPMDPAH